MKNWFKFGNIEIIIIGFITLLGFLQHWLAGLIMFGIGLIIHTITYFIFKNSALHSNKNKEVKK